MITDWLKSNKKLLDEDTCAKIVRDLETKFGKGNVELVGFVHDDCVIKIKDLTFIIDNIQNYVKS